MPVWGLGDFFLKATLLFGDVFKLKLVALEVSLVYA